MVVRGYSVGPLLKKTFGEIREDRVPAMAGSAAYNFFFSLFPLLLFLAPMLSLVGDKQKLVGFIMAQLTSVLPAAQLNAIEPILKDVVFADSAPALISVGLLLAAWSGSNIFGTLMGALNVAYDAEETRPWWKQQLIRLFTFALGVVIVVLSSVIILGGEDVANWLGRAAGIEGTAVTIWKIVQFPLAMLFLATLAFTTFWLLPNTKQRKSHVAVGAAATTVLWIIATFVFRLYIQHFPPNPAYGFIGGVIVMLGWMYYTMLVLLAGGELASELHHGTAAMEPRPGAIYLGRIVSAGGPGAVSTHRVEGK